MAPAHFTRPVKDLDCQPPTRIVLVDDHPMVRERLAELISRELDMVVCGEAGDRGEALEVIARENPTLVVVDLSLKNSSGLDLIKDLRDLRPGLPILVLSMMDENLFAERTIRAGAHGYLNKQEATCKVLEAIRQILAGRIYLSPDLSGEFLSRIVGRPQRPSQSIEKLSDRELQIFELLGQGYGSRQTAEYLGLDVKTIETYRSRLKEKLNLKNASELLRKAIAWRQERPS